MAKRPTTKISPKREALRKLVELSSYMESSMCPEHTKKELQKRIKSLSEIAYATSEK